MISKDPRAAPDSTVGAVCQTEAEAEAQLEHPPVVTIAALYGAGGSVVGPRVAERLGVVFLGRDIPDAVARRTGVPADAIAYVGEGIRSAPERLAGRMGRASPVSGGTSGSAGRLDLEERRLRAYIEEFLAHASLTGGVVLGHGAMVVLRSVPWALHVLLRGPLDERVRQAMEFEGVERAAAEARQRAEDRSRRGYVRRAYGADGDDPCWYHLVIDSTALDLDACVDVIVASSLARIHRPRPSPPI